MSNIIRVEHSKNYTVISNNAIRDKRISLKARGLHHLLLSYPDNWKISIEHLAKEASDTDGRTAIQNALKELEVFGYLTREQVRDEKGRITGWENVVRELPQAGFPIVDKTTYGKHHNRKNRKRKNPNVDNPHTENPSTENQYLINTDPYEVSKNQVTIPPTPQRGKEEVGESKNSAPPEEESGLSINPPILDQQNQPSNSANDKAYPEDKDSAEPRDNSVDGGANYHESSAAKNDALFQRPKLEPWLDKAGLNNWKPDFVEFYRKYLSSTPRYIETLRREATPGDAKNSLIYLTKSDEGKAQLQNHWENYQASLAPKPTAQPVPPRHDPLEGTEAIAPEFVQKLREIANLARSQKK